jgi:hypothetical protein
MKTKKYLNKLKCKLFGHKYEPEIWFDYNVQKIRCRRCHKKFGINHDVQAIIPWDTELENVMKLCYPEKFSK